jgi:hypothetical protein
MNRRMENLLRMDLIETPVPALVATARPGRQHGPAKGSPGEGEAIGLWRRGIARDARRRRSRERPGAGPIGELGCAAIDGMGFRS